MKFVQIPLPISELSRRMSDLGTFPSLILLRLLSVICLELSLQLDPSREKLNFSVSGLSVWRCTSSSNDTLSICFFAILSSFLNLFLQCFDIFCVILLRLRSSYSVKTVSSNI